MKKFLIIISLIIASLFAVLFFWIFLDKLSLMGETFDEAVWKKNPYERCGMTNNVKKILLKQKPKEKEVLEMLGPYDAEITGLDNSVYFLGLCQGSEGNLMHILYDTQKQLVNIKDLVNSKDFYKLKLEFIKQLYQGNGKDKIEKEKDRKDKLHYFDFYLGKKDLITGSFYTDKNKLMHYVAGCGGNSGLFVLFEDFKIKLNSLYFGNVGCVQDIKEDDLNKDGNNELIVYSRSGGTGISVNFMNIINYFNGEVNDIEIRLKGQDTSCAHFMFPSSKKEEIFNRLKLDDCSNHYLNAYSTEMKTSSSEINVLTTRKISFDNPILLDEFIKLNPSYPNGECSYEFGKIILNKKIELIQFPEECLINQ